MLSTMNREGIEQIVQEIEILKSPADFNYFRTNLLETLYGGIQSKQDLFDLGNAPKKVKIAYFNKLALLYHEIATKDPRNAFENTDVVKEDNKEELIRGFFMNAVSAYKLAGKKEAAKIVGIELVKKMLTNGIVVDGAEFVRCLNEIGLNNPEKQHYLTLFLIKKKSL